MAISTFDLFKVGIGPSSSHTVGPMKAARLFALNLIELGVISKVARVQIDLYGSLGLTGIAHGSPKAILLGLEGETPKEVDIQAIPGRLEHIRKNSTLNLAGQNNIDFNESCDLKLHRKKSLSLYSNGMTFSAVDSEDRILSEKNYFSVGGGFVVDESATDDNLVIEEQSELPYPFTTGEELLALCEQHSMSMSELMLANEITWRAEKEVHEELLELWHVMQACVRRGCEQEGHLPGGLKVQRRAALLHKKLLADLEEKTQDPMVILDWVTLYALAVNEENAAGGRIVTAPTNGAAGIIPAVLHYYSGFCPDADEEGVVDFLLTAAAIGILYKENASISGAEVGCQGEVGSACSMAAGALTAVLGGTPKQVENAAEIGMEHNLGLTCDPIGGLVQIPCIERNAMASVKAINAARMAMRGDGTHFVSLDKVIRTMRDTGRDMNDRYKETARGGLALNVLEVPVNITEC